MRLYREDGHADYPHDPGYLFDCEACEAECFCAPSFTECVHCALIKERAMNARTIRYLDRFNY
jgi:hypothetical protein